MKHEPMWVCIVPLAYDIMSLSGDEQTAIKLASSKAAAFFKERGVIYDKTGKPHTPESVLEYFGSSTYEINPETAIMCI